MDNLIVLKYIIIIELVLLFITGYFGGKTGMILTIIVSIVLFAWMILWAKGMGASFANSQGPIELKLHDLMPILVVLLTCLWVAFGLYLFIVYLQQGQSLSIVFYLWLITIVGTIGAISVIAYYNSYDYKEAVEIREGNKRMREEKERKEKEKREFREYSDSMRKLNDLYEISRTDKSKINKYIEYSEQMSQLYLDSEILTHNLSTYNSNLISYFCKSGDLQMGLQMGLQIFESYMDSILPNREACEANEMFASNAIVLTGALGDDTIFERVEEHILGKDFKIDELSHDLLLYNLACHYSLKENKEKLLIATARALEFGKLPEQFLEDKDFSNYLNDADFLSLLK